VTDPADALPLFQRSLALGHIPIQRGALDKSLYVATDDVNGHHRLSYMKLRGQTILALVQFVSIAPLEGTPCFQAGYAVPEAFRGQGLAKSSFAAALAEMVRGFGRFGDFYVETVVGLDNHASQKISEAALGGSPQQIRDAVSGRLALRYLHRFGTSKNPT
jgi:hypothetical protein